MSYIHVHVGSAPRPAGATAAVKGLLPPDKKKFEREVKEIGSQIKDLESQRVSYNMNIHVQCILTCIHVYVLDLCIYMYQLYVETLPCFVHLCVWVCPAN